MSTFEKDQSISDRKYYYFMIKLEKKFRGYAVWCTIFMCSNILLFGHLEYLHLLCSNIYINLL